MQRFGACLLAAAAASLALASAAQGNFVASAADPPGDAVDPSPGRDIIGASMSYDRRSGELIGAVQLRGVPGEARSFLTLFAGSGMATGCNGLPYAGFGSYSDEFGASWKRLDDPSGAGPSGDAEKLAYRDAVQRFEATDSQLAGHRLDCVIATISEPGNPANVYDSAGPLELVGQPALSMRVRGVGRPFKANRARKLKITLANAGDAATSPVRLRLSRARGVQAKPAKKSLGAIDPGDKQTVTVKVTLTGRARDATKLKVTAGAGELVVREKLTLQLRRPSKPGGGDGGADRPTQTCTRWLPDPFGGTGGSLILVAC
jgi:hypothetical protein